MLDNYQHVIADLTLITGSKGVFDVRVEDQVIYSKHVTGRYAEPGEILALFEDLLPPETAKYGT